MCRLHMGFILVVYMVYTLCISIIYTLYTRHIHALYNSYLFNKRLISAIFCCREREND